MEPSVIHESELWLPTEFLTNEDLLMEKENKGVFKGINYGVGFGFGKDGGESKFMFPNESRFGLNSGLGSPVESLFGSSETDSDDDNCLAGLTRQMAHSTLKDDFSGGFGGHHNFPAENNNKGWSHAGSPQSTLCVAGISCGCRRRPAQNCQPQVPPPASWDPYLAAAEEMVRMNIGEEPYCFNHGGRGLLDQPVKPSPVPFATTENHRLAALHYQKLQGILFQQLKQEQQQQHQMMMLMKNRQVMQNRGRLGGNYHGRSVGLPPSAWPNHRHAQHAGMRTVFLGNQAVKRVSSGTGVFLPRRDNPSTGASNVNKKKQTLSTVLVPERVAQALNLSGQPHFEPLADLNDASMRLRSNSGGFYGGMRADQAVPLNEFRLPSDWSY